LKFKHELTWHIKNGSPDFSIASIAVNIDPHHHAKVLQPKGNKNDSDGILR